VCSLGVYLVFPFWVDVKISHNLSPSRHPHNLPRGACAGRVVPPVWITPKHVISRSLCSLLFLGFSTPKGDVFFNIGDKDMSEEIRIYVACLAAYNNGKLHGVWIDACLDADEIQEQVSEMLASSPEPDAEEWAIHDYEGFGSYSLSEYESFEAVSELACFISEHGELAAELLGHFSDIDEAKKAMDENYAGCHESVADFAQEMTEDTAQVPEHLVFYIDYEKMGRDMELGGDIFTIETAYREVHIFWNH